MLLLRTLTISLPIVKCCCLRWLYWVPNSLVLFMGDLDTEPTNPAVLLLGTFYWSQQLWSLVAGILELRPLTVECCCWGDLKLSSTTLKWSCGDPWTANAHIAHHRNNILTYMWCGHHRFEVKVYRLQLIISISNLML